jgi:hypothetical protein
MKKWPIHRQKPQKEPITGEKFEKFNELYLAGML